MSLAFETVIESRLLSEAPAVIAKWLDDLIDAAEHAASAATPAKRTAKPSAAQKRSNEWQQEDNQEKVQGKRKKTGTVEKANKHAANIAKTAQSVNWNFDDLEDIAEEKVYETGRKGYPIVDKIVIACKSIETGDRRWRCLADSSAGTNRAERSYTGDLPKGWTLEDMENGESNPKGPAVDDSDAGSDSGDEVADNLPDLTGCDSTVESVLGVNLSSRVLQDLLADCAQLLDSSGPARSASTSNGAGTSSSVKKDTSQ
ncbi:hypothetical protein FRC07_005035, partial [Ceratobasidium sp. 392]